MQRKLFAIAWAACLSAGAAPTAELPASAAPGRPSQDPLLARCELLKRQADRSTCITEVIRASTAQSATAPPGPADTPPKPSNKEAALNRAKDVFSAAEAVKSVVNVGISYNDYSPYIERFAIALDAYRAGVRLPEEVEAADLLTKALDACKDAREFWRIDIDFYSRRDSYYGYPNGLPVDMVGLRPIVNKYNVPTQNANWLGLQQGVPRGVALAKLWGVASDDISAARVTLDEIDKPAPQIPSPALDVAANSSVVDELPAAIMKMARGALLGAGCDPIGKPSIVREPGKQDAISFQCSGTDSWQTAICGEGSCQAVEGPRFVMKAETGPQ